MLPPAPPRKILEDAPGVRGKVGKRHFWVTRSNYNIIIKSPGIAIYRHFVRETEGSGRIHARIRADPQGSSIAKLGKRKDPDGSMHGSERIRVGKRGKRADPGHSHNSATGDRHFGLIQVILIIQLPGIGIS